MSQGNLFSDQLCVLGANKSENTTMLVFSIRNNSKREQSIEKIPHERSAEVVSTSNPVSHLYQYRHSFRLIFLTVLTLVGFFVLAGSGIRTAGMPAHAPVPHTTINASYPFHPSHQATLLSGSGESIPQASTVPAFCAPFDVNCWLGQAAQWIA